MPKSVSILKFFFQFSFSIQWISLLSVGFYFYGFKFFRDEFVCVFFFFRCFSSNSGVMYLRARYYPACHLLLIPVLLVLGIYTNAQSVSTHLRSNTWIENYWGFSIIPSMSSLRFLFSVASTPQYIWPTRLPKRLIDGCYIGYLCAGQTGWTNVPVSRENDDVIPF